MNILQMVLIALFVYLGSIGSVVGNTIGWYTLGRPLVASFVVGLIMTAPRMLLRLCDARHLRWSYKF